jgi:endonuclease/exonuclease/phosphatase family metal-dependent hydrolase
MMRSKTYLNSFLSAIALLLLSCGAVCAQGSERPVVVSFNLHGLNSNGYSGSGCSRIPTDVSKFKQVIQQTRASVVFAQEIHRGQADDLARALGFPSPYFVWTKTCSSGHRALDYGNAIISRYPLTARHRYSLHTAAVDRARKEYTRLAAASVVVNGHRIRLYCTHTTAKGTEDEKNGQVADILRIVQQDQASAGAGHRSILGADLNFTPTSTQYLRLVPFGIFKDAWAERNPALGSGPTAPAESPRIRIDYVLLEKNGGFGVEAVEVVNVCQGNVCLSDHRPVKAQLSVR